MADEPKTYNWGEIFANTIDWLFRNGKPTPNSVDVNTILLADIALSVRRLVQLSREAQEMNNAILASLDRAETEDDDLN